VSARKVDTFKHVFVCGMSRSGTTLLTTILDSHPQVSMGYELLPVDLPTAENIIELIVSAQARAGDSTDRVIELLDRDGHQSLSNFVMRCDRALVSPDELISICRGFITEGVTNFEGPHMRIRLSLAVAEMKRVKERTLISGFKVNMPSVEIVSDVVPNAFFVYVVRDPRDVVASHFAANFQRSIPEITRAWENYLMKFKMFSSDHPESSLIISYEELVSSPEDTLGKLFGRLKLSTHEDSLAFFDSKASVHRRDHPNSVTLKSGFSTASVARWQTELNWEQVDEVQKACPQLESIGYLAVSDDEPVSLDPSLRRQKAEAFSRRQKYFRNEYAKLLAPYRYLPNLTWDEAAGGEKARGEEILILRHDIDHDYESALRMARWERAEGFRSTYCILHSAWYYSRLEDDRLRHTQEMLDCCLELQALGHEVSFHNNVVATSLREGVSAHTLLEGELWFLRSHGLQITGSATHGDKLCHELNFRNFELFRECVYESRGGPRTVEFQGNAVELGVVPMSRFGLRYEAYDLPRDVYITDSGGHLRLKTDTPGRGGRSRSEMSRQPPYPKIVGILTHPCWWDFEQTSDREFQVLELEASVE
jgi:hypothetical protein